MSFTDYLRLNEHKIFKELCDSIPKILTNALNVITIHDNVLFAWDFQNNCVLSLNLKAARSKEGDNVIHQKLLPLHPPLFIPEFLLVNEPGTLLAVAGSQGILVLELPSRCPPYGAFDNNKEVVSCKTHSLDERLLACSDTIELRQVKFHPGSINHSHILALTSDNNLRLYNVKNGEAVNVGVYSVGEKPTTFFPGSKTPFLDIYGEVAVDFDFGYPQIAQVTRLAPERSLVIQNKNNYLKNAETQTIDKIIPKSVADKQSIDKDWNNLVWPVFILRSDMSVYCLEIDLRKRWKPTLQGPLSMTGFKNEQIEACCLICLKTVPQIICVAFSDGTLCQSILLDTEEDNDVSNQELLAFESVKLELGLIISENFDTTYKCPIMLHKDDSKPGRYYATHVAGVHSVIISCVDNLEQYVNISKADDQISDIFSNHSKVEYLICTKTAASDNSNPVIGFALYYEPTSIIALLGDGSLVTLGVFLSSNLPRIEDLIISDEGTVSPLKKMLQEPFEQYIEKILKKTSTQPILKLSAKKETSQEECYELLQSAAHIFREDYFKNHVRAREEIEKRIHMLVMMKKSQQKEIESMKSERDSLRDTASDLAEKYEDIKDKQDELLKRSENLLMLVSGKRSSPSQAEKTFVKDLQTYSEKIGIYGDKIDKIKNKMKYQQIQMENWKSQEIKKVAAINETHTNTIKTNLQDTTKKMTDMIKHIYEFKNRLDLK